MNKMWKSALLIPCLAWAGLSLSATAVQGQTPIKLNYSVFFPAPHIHSQLAIEWGKELEKVKAQSEQYREEIERLKEQASKNNP